MFKKAFLPKNYNCIKWWGLPFNRMWPYCTKPWHIFPTFYWFKYFIFHSIRYCAFNCCFSYFHYYFCNDNFWSSSSERFVGQTDTDLSVRDRDIGSPDSTALSAHLSRLIRCNMVESQPCKYPHWSFKKISITFLYFRGIFKGPCKNPVTWPKRRGLIVGRSSKHGMSTITHRPCHPHFSRETPSFIDIYIFMELIKCPAVINLSEHGGVLLEQEEHSSTFLHSR